MLVLGIFDVFKAKQFKQEATELKSTLEELKNEKLSVEQMSAVELKEDILSKQTQLEKLKATISNRESELLNLNKKIESKKEFMIDADEIIEMESYGLYKPKYDFADSLTYKQTLVDIRNQQKQMIKTKEAVSFSTNWTVDGSKAKGKKMVNETIKQILRSFNVECEAAINKVKYNNIDSIEKRIQLSYDQLNKLNQSMKVSINYSYLQLKKKELYLAYEYERKKQEEKEELREQREKEREEKALQREVQSQKKIIDKDIKHYQNMIAELEKKLKEAESSEVSEEIQNQILELSNKVTEKEEEKEDLDYRTAHAAAGYVYIISNIGAFGKDVVKIGVTRRLEPLERISELSSASVPFRFDVHALIFSYDAYKLESDLHHYFENYRLNKVNSRKEFFRVPIEEIELKLAEYKDLTIDFQKEPDAEEYRESMALNN